MWVICSGCSGQMSNCEQIAQVAHKKWANVSDSLGFLNSKKIVLLYVFTVFLKFKKKKKICSFLLSKVSESLRLLRTNEWPWAICSEGMSDHERIAQVAHQKWANEQITHFLSESLICSLFWHKTSNSLRNWMSKFPTLKIHHFVSKKGKTMRKNWRKKCALKHNATTIIVWLPVLHYMGIFADPKCHITQTFQKNLA